LIKDLRCWGLRPSKPPEEPVGKEVTAFRTSSLDTVRGSTDEEDGASPEFRVLGGCLALNLEAAISDGAASGSSDNSSRTAALMLPSSSLREMRFARTVGD